MAWMRANSQSSERAIDLASIVLPTPGKSSRMMWPSHSSAITHRSSRPSGAWITRRDVLDHAPGGLAGGW